jgi:hypothetical protein
MMIKHWSLLVLAGAVLCFVAVALAQEKKQPAGPEGPLLETKTGARFDVVLPVEAGISSPFHRFRGVVNGIDVMAAAPNIYNSGLLAEYCSAYVNSKQPGAGTIQVVTSEHRLQTVLESAAARGVEVEVTYFVRNDKNVLTRVRMLDRK